MHESETTQTCPTSLLDGLGDLIDAPLSDSTPRPPKLPPFETVRLRAGETEIGVHEAFSIVVEGARLLLPIVRKYAQSNALAGNELLLSFDAAEKLLTLSSSVRDALRDEAIHLSKTATSEAWQHGASGSLSIRSNAGSYTECVSAATTDLLNRNGLLEDASTVVIQAKPGLAASQIPPDDLKVLLRYASVTSAPDLSRVLKLVEDGRIDAQLVHETFEKVQTRAGSTTVSYTSHSPLTSEEVGTSKKSGKGNKK